MHGSNLGANKQAERLARRYLASRRRRAKTFGDGLLHDPAWDMLLDLYSHRMTGVRISVSSACIASGVPNTTALAWLGRLEEQGLVVREPDSRDQRRTVLEITEGAAAALERWLNATFVAWKMHPISMGLTLLERVAIADSLEWVSLCSATRGGRDVASAGGG